MSDFRAAAQDSKRYKEHKAKWSKGARPSPGVQFDRRTNAMLTGSESQQAKLRPEKKGLSTPREYPNHNLIKPHNGRPSPFPQSHTRARYDAMAELGDPNNASLSLRELLPSPHHHGRRPGGSVSDQVFYSFDQADSPGRPLSLDAFVKANPKETERFVEKEYEILDGDGDALKGRKARRNLRQRNPQPAVPDDEVALEIDGFEVI